MARHGADGTIHNLVPCCIVGHIDDTLSQISGSPVAACINERKSAQQRANNFR